MKTHEILIRPLMTEKGYSNVESRSEYPFAVDKRANKVQIRSAVETLFNVKVAEVRTMVMPGKRRRRGWVYGRTSEWKKALVRLQPGQTITFV